MNLSLINHCLKSSFKRQFFLVDENNLLCFAFIDLFPLLLKSFKIRGNRLSKLISDAIIANPYITQGAKTMNPITIGNKIVQLNNINWSNLIRGKEALTQIKVNTIKQDLKPKLKPYNIPSINGLDKITV